MFNVLFKSMTLIDFLNNLLLTSNGFDTVLLTFDNQTQLLANDIMSAQISQAIRHKWVLHNVERSQSVIPKEYKFILSLHRNAAQWNISKYSAVYKHLMVSEIRITKEQCERIAKAQELAALHDIVLWNGAYETNSFVSTLNSFRKDSVLKQISVTKDFDIVFADKSVDMNAEIVRFSLFGMEPIKFIAIRPFGSKFGDQLVLGGSTGYFLAIIQKYFNMKLEVYVTNALRESLNKEYRKYSESFFEKIYPVHYTDTDNQVPFTFGRPEER